MLHIIIGFGILVLIFGLFPRVAFKLLAVGVIGCVLIALIAQHEGLHVF